MKLLAALFASLLLAACSQVSLHEPESGDREVSGTVTFRGESLPPDAVLLVRVIDQSNPALGDKVLGEQEIKDPGPSPVAFKVAFFADSSLIRRGVRLDARISVGGRLRYTQTMQSMVNAQNLESPRQIQLVATGG